MSSARTINVLNALLTAETSSLVGRLGESDPFVGLASAADRALVQRMCVDEREHERALIEMILDLRGIPRPRYIPTETGGVHYLDLAYLMPAVISSKRRLVEAYRAAGGTDDERANALIARNLANHERHLAELQRVRASLSSVTV